MADAPVRFKVGDLVTWADWVLEESNGSNKPEVPHMGAFIRRGGLGPKEYADIYFGSPPFNVVQVVEIRDEERLTAGHTQSVYVQLIWKNTGETRVKWYSGKWFRKVGPPHKKK